MPGIITDMKKTRLLCCIQDFRGRGAEKVLATLLAKLDRERYEIGVFVLHDIFALDVPKDVIIMSAHAVTHPLTAPLMVKVRENFRKVYAVRKAIRAFSPDVILSVSGTNVLLVLAKYLTRTQFKLILSEHTLPSLFIPETGGAFVQIVTRLVIRLAYPRADRILTPSKGVADDLVHGFGVPRDRIGIIPNPLDLERIASAAQEEPPVPFPQDGSFRIGYVGGLSREKNPACLIRAFALLLKQGVKARLFLVGNGGQREELQTLASALSVADRVHFLGFQKNPYALLSRFAVLAVPSFYETFSYVMLEAMACGVPAVSTRWPGSEELYEDGKNCVLVPLDDPGGMATGIRAVLASSELRERITTNGRALARTCSADAVLRQYEALISGAAAGRS
jgi:glycosyltransferase involved in cell wall biosynthesis